MHLARAIVYMVDVIDAGTNVCVVDNTTHM